MEGGTPFGRYRLLDLLGRGGMGEVWRAFDTVTERVVALKVLPTEFADDARYQERFRREAKSAAGLDEPHVVPIYDFGEIDGRLFVTMRLIKGRDLQSIIRSDGPMDAARAVRIVDQVASALQAAHQVNLVHRDVKPSNILVGDDDFAYLIDFGIARAAGQSSLTGTARIIGSWAYLAPERITGDQIDGRADIYALACVLYECLTGSQPFPGNSLEQQMGGHLGTPPPHPSERRPDVPAQLDAVIAKGMAKKPDDRYATARELARAASAAVTAPATVTNPLAPAATARPITYPQPTRQPQYGHVANPPAPPPSGPPPTDRIQHGRMPYGPPPGPRSSPVSPLPSGPSRADPNQYRPMFYGPPPPGPKASRKGRVIALTSVGAAVVVAVVVAIVLSVSSDDGAHPPVGPAPSVPNTGPFTGTFTADLGPKTTASGAPRTDAEAAAFSGTWRLRSACTGASCVATAASGGRYPVKDLVFDKVGEDWLAVATSKTKCGYRDGTEAWNVISVRPQADGTLSGEYTQISTNGCFDKRTVKFTRIADVDISLLPDPATLPPRVVSPAEALHGGYEVVSISENGSKEVDHYGVRTQCLRTGDRCVSPFLDPRNDTDQVFVFENENWTRNEEFDSSCSTGGTNHITATATLPLPQPPQNPITLLSGRGYFNVGTAPGSTCHSQGFDEKFTRTGD